jgi:hypothetical protein
VLSPLTKRFMQYSTVLTQAADTVKHVAWSQGVRQPTPWKKSSLSGQTGHRTCKCVLAWLLLVSQSSWPLCHSLFVGWSTPKRSRTAGRGATSLLGPYLSPGLDSRCMQGAYHTALVVTALALLLECNSPVLRQVMVRDAARGPCLQHLGSTARPAL